MTIFLDRLKIFYLFSLLYLFSFNFILHSFKVIGIYLYYYFLSFINDTFVYFIGRYLRGPLIFQRLVQKNVVWYICFIFFHL